jgi:hypothetical protein
LSRGPRVTLRLARGRDLTGIRALLERRGGGLEDLDVARLVRCDPRRRIVLCATALLGSAEVVVGVGAIDVGAGLPDLLVVDDALTEGLDQLLTHALIGRATAIARARAA